MATADTELPAQVQAILRLVEQRIHPVDVVAVTQFVTLYLSGIAAEDLSERSVDDNYGAAISHWNFFKSRDPGRTKVRAYNPHVAEHGWQSTHSVVEIATDDMPFLIDSVGMALNRLNLTIHLVIHPVPYVTRDSSGAIEAVSAVDPGQRGNAEAVIHVEFDRQLDEAGLQRVQQACEGALADVESAVRDWHQMRNKLAAVTADLVESAGSMQGSEAAEAKAFLDWLGDDHFTFLGYRYYALTSVRQALHLEMDARTGLGILREAPQGGAPASYELVGGAREIARAPSLLVVTKANSRATVHRPSYLDYVGVKRFDAAGKVVGEHRFLGLYTSAAYNRSPRDIPLLRDKVAAVMRQARYPDNSHAAKALLNILETFPRDLLFQVDVDELLDTARGILHLQERQRVRLFVHRDPFERYFTCIVFVPRERFNTAIRRDIESTLSTAFGANDTEFNVRLSDSNLAQLYFVFRTPLGTSPDYAVNDLEEAVREMTRAWHDKLFDAALGHFGEGQGTRLMQLYREAFRADYREYFSARVAVVDIEHMENLTEEPRALALSLYRPLEATADELRFKLFLRDGPFPLSQALPMLENMGVVVEEERPSKIKRGDGARIWMHDFGLRFDGARELDLESVREKFHTAIHKVWLDEAENDGFNRLVLRAGLSWRDIVVLRACCKYLRQATIAFSQAYMERALHANPTISSRLVKLFHARLNPDEDTERESRCNALVGEIVEALEAVANLDEDRILRSYLGLIQSILRTNYYQCRDDGEPKSYLSFKLDPHGIAELPEPRPMYEIFVYSPQVEGVHLRGGPVARGGLRWSDRAEDFRTEVLGLVKAQIVKNAVIVPVGSKGGFYPKRLPAPSQREAFLEGGKAAYRTFIRGLLDITDNLVGGEVVPPPGVLRHDGDDAYLGVAADKGTATFSDIANEIALDYGYWLGDAFASGGSQGYDHKGMGITAKGAWESVKRHFRALGFDTQTEPFTVVGIGDMSGDVFGNGMLLSEQVKLVAAFNHLHIFVDPDPDPALGYAQRSRLFELPRSTWDDYDRACISTGGGVYPRSAKSIALSKEARRVLDTEASELTPNALIHAILQAPVDLVWNGGIGTYVKSAEEHHDEVGDHANDGVRIDGRELRCQVVGEGGNLGFTQLGRVEYAQRGGRIFTDAIDNSAGVDCSDHEVNIKVLLNDVVASGDMTAKQRNALLAEMTDEVSALVLRDNYLQTQALSVAHAQAPALLEVHERLIKDLERHGELDPEIEYLPDAEGFSELAQARAGLTTPELSVLLAYAKIDLFKELMASGLANDRFMLTELTAYFPEPLRERYSERIEKHRLSREIICTVVANEVVNRAGITGLFRLKSETGAHPSHIAIAYLAAREIFAMHSLWDGVEALDNKVNSGLQNQLLLEGRKLLERAARWLIRNRLQPMDVGSTVERYLDGVSRLTANLPELVGEIERAQIRQRTATLVDQGVPDDLATRVACFEDLFSGLDMVEVALSVDRPVEDVARVYFQLGGRLDFLWFRERVAALPRDNRWQALARSALRDDLYSQQSRLTADAIASGVSVEADLNGSIDVWLASRGRAVKRCQQLLADLKAYGHPDFTMLSVAMRELRAMQAGHGNAAP